MQLTQRSRVTSSDFPGDPLAPESWVRNRGEVLREMAHRRVYRATVGDLRVVVKEYQPSGLRRLWRNYAESEADTALQTARRGVPVVSPLAWARLGDGRQLLVLREEPGTRPLQEIVLEGRTTGRARHDLARAVGELFARMQNAGIRHDDPHAGNILVRPDGSVLLSDAGDLRPIAGYLTETRRAADLARFALFFLTHASRVDLLVFWGEYGRASQLLPEQLERLRQGVLDRVPDAFRRLAGSRARRARRHGRSVSFGAFEGLVFEQPDGGEPDDAVMAEIAARALTLEDDAQVLKRSRTCWTFLAGPDGRFVAKAYQPKKATRGLRDLLLGTRAERAVEAAEALRHRGLRTPEVVASLRDAAVPQRSILLMRRVTDARPLEEALTGLAPAQAREAARVVGRTLRRMHDWGLRQRDLKADNLWLDPAGAEVTFLDLDGVRQAHGKLDWELRARDLAHLAGSLLDFGSVPTGLRLRALAAYLEEKPPDGLKIPAFTRKVARLAREERERRLGLLGRHAPRAGAE